MKNIEKYQNTKDALEAYNSLAFKTVSFDTWLECEFEEHLVSTLIEAAAEMVYAWKSEFEPGYTARVSKAIGRLSDAIAREKCKPVRILERFATDMDAHEAFIKFCDNQMCENCRFGNKSNALAVRLRGSTPRLIRRRRNER